MIVLTSGSQQVSMLRTLIPSPLLSNPEPLWFDPQDNLYDDPTRVPVELEEPELSLKASGKKCLPPESLGTYDDGISFTNPNYAEMGLGAVTVELPPEEAGADGAAGDEVDFSKGESES